MTLAAKRDAASVIVTEFGRTWARSCRLVGIRPPSGGHRRGFRARRGEAQLAELAYLHPRRGYLRLGIFVSPGVRPIDHGRFFTLLPAEGLLSPGRRLRVPSSTDPGRSRQN